MKNKLYKLINRKTNEEYLCKKVTIDGFDYYVTDDIPKKDGDSFVDEKNRLGVRGNYVKDFMFTHCKKIIATTNSNIDISKIVNEVEELAKEIYKIPFPDKFSNLNQEAIKERYSFINGYNKSRETYHFSEEDMRECWKAAYEESFNKWIKNKPRTTFKKWLKQQTIKLYYE